MTMIAPMPRTERRLMQKTILDGDAFHFSMKHTMNTCLNQGDFDGIIQHLNPYTVIARLFSVFTGFVE